MLSLYERSSVRASTWSIRRRGPRPCPHCQGGRTQRYGLFRLSDGTPQQRYHCRDCRKTFIARTNTPLAYLKKRQQWKRMVWCMRRGYSLRKTASLVQVQVSTAFRWRHRLLHDLDQRHRPTMAGHVLAGVCFVRYSEKGSRCSGGPGARRKNYKGPRFRRLADGRPSSVLLLKGEGPQGAAVILGQGRLTVDRLIHGLKPLVETGSTLSADGWTEFADACGQIGLRFRDWYSRAMQRANRRDWGFPRGLYFWLTKFHGIATKYLPHYLCWYLGSKNIAHMVLSRAG